ncbi:N-6 DNA methylase [Helicobacter pylori]|nr:N-6 DNA methylase [Helicobacter pylori]UOS09648.1 N-6 DNA methylase [Helicobacter pylori]
MRVRNLSKKARKTSSKNTTEKRFCKLNTERKVIKHFSALANMERIKENDYNLSVNRYVEQEDTKEIIDIKVLQFEISQIVERQSALRNSLDRIIKELEEGQNA